MAINQSVSGGSFVLEAFVILMVYVVTSKVVHGIHRERRNETEQERHETEQEGGDR